MQNYLIEGFTIYAASALAAGVFLRSVVATFLPLVGPSMNEALGLGWYVPHFKRLMNGKEQHDSGRHCDSQFATCILLLRACSDEMSLIPDTGIRYGQKYAEDLPINV